MAITDTRRGLLALLASAVFVLGSGGLALLWLNSGDEADSAPLVAATTQPPAATAPAPEAPDEVPATALPPEAEEPPDAEFWMDTKPLPPMGIEAIDFDWQVIEPLPEPGGDAWFSDVFEFEGELWAVAGSIDWEADEEFTYIWTSLDGIEWVPKELPEDLSGGPPELVVTDTGLVAVAGRWEEDRPRLRVFVTTDGDDWVEGDLSALSDRAQRLSQPLVAASPGGTVVAAGSVEGIAGAAAEPAVVTISKDGYTVTLDEGAWAFTLTDPSGSVVGEGSQAVIWEGDREWLEIYDPSTGSPVFFLSWDALQEIPVGAYEQAEFGEPMLLEFTNGDLTMTIDEYTGALTITDDSGAVIFRGTEEDLWAGRPPTFTDPATGEVILQIPWAEWDAAYEAALPSDADWAALPVVVVSTDGGLTWRDAAVPDLGVNFYLGGVAYGPGGFLVVGGGEDRDGQLPQIPILLASADGLSWSLLDSNVTEGWVGSLVGMADTFMASIWTPHEQSVAISRDGVTWAPALSESDLELPLGSARFGWMVDGELGTFVLGNRDGWEEPEAVPIYHHKQGRTLAVEGSIFTITDDVTGEVLFNFDESSTWDREDSGVAATGFKWGLGGLLFFDEDGMVLFALSHREFEEPRSDGVEPELMYEDEAILLFDPGDGWVSVQVSDLDVDLVDIVVEADRIVAVATEPRFDYSMGLSILVGSPRDQ